MHYYNIKHSQDYMLRTKANRFWVDYAKHLVSKFESNGVANRPFLSKTFKYAINTHTEMIAVLSLIDIPFEAGHHLYERNQFRGMDIKAKSNFIIFHQEIVEIPRKEQDEETKDILVTRRYFEPNDRFDILKDNKKVTYILIRTSSLNHRKATVI